MDLAWSPAQLALRDRVIAFARQELTDDVRARDRASGFSREHWRRCAQFGIQGLHLPARYGGQGQDLLTTVLALEALGYGCPDNGLTFALNAHMWAVQPAIVEHAHEAQRQRYLPGICRGELIGCYAVTEPGSGSDAFALTTRATRVEGGYRLDGEKALITFAPIADFAIVFATIDPAKQRWGVTAFIIDRGTPGFSSSPVEEKMGLRTVPIGQLHFANCIVPESSRLGAEGAGASIFSSSQEYERGCILASQVGAMQRQLETALAYARGRRAFGQAIGKFQAVGHRLVEMKLRLEVARLLLYQAAWTKMHGQSAMLAAALANLYLGDAFVESSLDAIRVHGGRGYLTEYEIERDLRDAVAGPIFGGTADIQRNIIGQLLGL